MNRFNRGLRTITAAAGLSVAGLTTLATGAFAQCAGDCDGNGSVSINELIRGVNIALGQQNLDVCPAFDTNDNSAVSISELIQAVNAALRGCPAVTPAATATPTNTEVPVSPTATPTERVVPPNCGDGAVNLDEGETCDDGNREEGPRDFCPANCSVLQCSQQVPRQTFTVDVNFNTDSAEVLVQALTIFIRYPDGVVGIPGANNDPPVVASITAGFFDAITPNDQEYGLTLVLQDQSFSGSTGGTAVSVEFDVCQGASQPSLDELTCVIAGATDINFTDVPERVSCQLALP